MCTLHTAHVEVRELIFSFHLEGPRDRTQVVRLGSKHLYPWTHLSGLLRHLMVPKLEFSSSPNVFFTSVDTTLCHCVSLLHHQTYTHLLMWPNNTVPSAYFFQMSPECLSSQMSGHRLPRPLPIPGLSPKTPSFLRSILSPIPPHCVPLILFP